MRDFILALDQGTTSCRAIVFDRDGNCKGIAKKEFPQIFPQPGWVEHDPFDIWNTQLETARGAIAQAGITAADIAAIGITNQRETTLLWDRQTGQPIHNAIVWQDRRSAPFCNLLREQGHEPLFKARTGLLLDAYFSGSKIRWLLDNVAGARELATQGRLAFGTVDTWLIWMLTGGAVHVTDATNASRTLMYDIKNGRWDEDLLDRLGVPAAILPQVCSSSAVVGETLPELFGAPIPIAGIAGDQQAASFGQACTKEGMAKNTYGTGCFMLMNISTAPKVDPGQLITTIAWDIANTRTYALEGSVFIAGAVVQWLRDCLGIIRSSEDIEALAATVPDAGGVYFVPAFVGLGAPHWDSNARGTIVGLTRGTTAGHIARAALEAIAFQSADVLTTMQHESGTQMTQLRVDGGGSANNLMMQFQADILGVPVVRPKITETTALGAAYLAGLAVGYWKDVAELEALWQIDRVFEPAMDAGLRQERTTIWHRAVSRSATWLT